jgi:hypothetical protein
MEHRKAVRRVPAREEPLSRLRLRTGREVAVVDISNTGALVEGQVWLLPGTHVDVHVVARDGRTLVRSRIVRCWITRLDADAVCYRGALTFERTVDTASVGYAIPEASHAGRDVQGPDYPSSAHLASSSVAGRLCA